jgi:glyoxylase-like metal-dependent hydrolase (beta-lactamase superfamily II)
MEIIIKSLGVFAANCFILWNDREAVVIDPGGNPEIIMPEIGDRTLRYIINTHGHYDHIAANNAIKAYYDTRLAVSEEDHRMIMDPRLNLSVMVDAPFISVPPDLILHQGDLLPFGDLEMRVLHTPGHTEGSICLILGEVLFSGDTLFRYSVGRTDLPGGSENKLRESIRSQLYTLPDRMRVYPGHGEPTTIGEEKRHNEFVRLNTL